uniref:DNA repair protein complementing XP-C cells n=1 Tax=Aceria tosichella TaxID=561515 RepID=A0A6G1S737_9ACAR
MVRIQIPMTTPIDEDEDAAGTGDEDGVGIMSDITESDVDDDIADPDWEEVKGEQDKDDAFSFAPGKMPNIPQNGITIEFDKPKRPSRRSRASKKKDKKNGDLDEDDEDEESDDGEDMVSTKKRKRLDMNEIVRRSINRVKITEQLMKHKLSLLLYLARGLRLVKIINCNIVKGLSMSVMDNNFKIPRSRKRKEREFIELFMEKFNELIAICDDDDKRSKHMQQPFMLNLLDCYASLETTSLIELVVMFIACLKAMKPDIPVRIVNVLRPISLRANIIPKPAEGEPMKEVIVEPQVSEEIVEKLDYWVEVYLADEKKWCCVDLCNAKLDEPAVLTELSRPFRYLVTYDVDRYCVKAAEKNYCENWYTPGFRKGRCEDKWWDNVMEALGPSKHGDKDVADESKTEEILTNQDMPTSDSAFKNHPIYVLEKHLLKFQGIYPPEVVPLGFFKDQPVYPRDCVHTLRSRETWLRQARTVKLNETAYKVVKARPKRDKYTGDLIKDLPLEIFGEWQTEPYDPPTAENGKVPRNCYGNVDMYQPCMLPKGCVWLKLQGLQRVANKLKIDCAAAVTGFDNHCGRGYGSHPVTEGFIVCEEYADTLQAAWEEEQVNIAKRELDKQQKRVWDNWRRLLKAAMIRERLRVKYKNS